MCNEKEDLDKQWEPLGITHEQALEDWDEALKENFGEEVLEKVREMRRQNNDE